MSELWIKAGQEYKQNNNWFARIVAVDEETNMAFGYANWRNAVGSLADSHYRRTRTWHAVDGWCHQYADHKLMPPEPIIEIPDDVMEKFRRRCWLSNGDGIKAVAISAIEWDRTNRPKREPTSDEISECMKMLQPFGYGYGPVAAIRHAFKLAQQEPK